MAMTINWKSTAFILVLAIGLPGTAISQTNKLPPAQKAPASARKKAAPKRQTLDQRHQFVVDVVKSAVALQQTDSQDRLRVLSAAANIVSPIDRAMARDYAREGMRIEQELIQSGQTPATSMFEGGQADCEQVTTFVENIPTARVTAAEQSLVGAMSLCPKQAIEAVKRKVQAGMEEGHIAPRALLALVENVGPSSQWSQEQFSKMFSSLPADAKANAAEAPNYAAMYDRMAPVLDKAVAKTSGMQLLLWLGKLDDSGERNLSVSIVTDSMKGALGDKGYQEALASDVMVSQVAQTAGRPGEIQHPEEESVSVLQALGKQRCRSYGQTRRDGAFVACPRGGSKRFRHGYQWESEDGGSVF